MEMEEVVKLLIVIVVLILLIGAVVLLLNGKAGALLDSIKNLMRVGK